MNHAVTQYDLAYEKLKHARDWPTRLGCAETLSQSPRHADTATAREVFKAYSMHLAQAAQDEDMSEYRWQFAAMVIGGLAAIGLAVWGL